LLADLSVVGSGSAIASFLPAVESSVHAGRNSLHDFRDWSGRLFLTLMVVAALF